MSLDWCTTGALVVLATWLLWKYLSWNHGYWQRVGVPCPEPSVPFGNIKHAMIGKKHITEVIRDIYCQMEGQPFCGFYRFREPLLLVRDADLARTMLVRDFTSFHDNSFHVDENLDPLFARNPFFLKGEKWRKLRSQLSPSFTASRLKPMFLLMKEVSDDLVRVLKDHSKASGDGVEALGLCMRYTTDVVTSCALGIKGGALDDQKSEMLEMFSLILEPNTNSSIRFMITSACPRLASLLHLRLMPEEVHNFLRSVVGQTVARRQHDGVYRNDYLQMLVELKTKGYLDGAGQVLADKSFFTDVDIAAQVTTFMTDGVHTSSTAMSFVLYELALHPDVQQRLRQELREALSKHGGQLGYDVIQEATYLDMVISETLRLFPPGGHLEKTCTAAYPLTTAAGRSVTLQPGTTVVVSIFGLHRDPRYFPEPDVFDPERFSPDNKDRTSMQAFTPFGLGPRSCLGQRFALSQVKMGLAAIVLSLEICCTPLTSKSIEMDPKSLLTANKNGLWLAFRPLTT
ncbi:probable cytochrome P450 6a20 [Schistocerca cancellata]|uniref:probable cytochrome P450 6a20 n=1 Tax=Schistocerca cancellata TaxID=274614 RepID=UPI002119032F|nr:probable cytochrome P450 6a20 [Schistocerca cancellata]XP_049764814.1 probable cytochrome P450 6a20 [Schistocerca cancellata]XP_049764815.1 probable cytochrome P450 6a20 [Schistocerca cancellata]